GRYAALRGGDEESAGEPEPPGRVQRGLLPRFELRSRRVHPARDHHAGQADDERLLLLHHDQEGSVGRTQGGEDVLRAAVVAPPLTVATHPTPTGPGGDARPCRVP